jgi:N,N'-diacetyllegionaminate synthase
MKADYPYIIAEIASAHEGEKELALDLFKLAAQTGADAVKFQMFDRDTLMSRYHHKYDAFGIIQISADEWREVLTEAGQSNVDIHVEVFDETSLELAESVDVVSGYKIPTSDIGNLQHLRNVASTGKQVYLAVGGALSEEIESAITTLKEVGCNQPILMLGFQSFPTKLEDSNLVRLRMLREQYGLPVGYADHIDAEDTELARLVPAMSMSAGASVIEKHITFDRSKKGRDYYSSLNPDEFKAFTALIRRLHTAMGQAEITLNQAEIDYRYLMKRQAVASQDIAPGDILSEGLVSYKRTGIEGLSPKDIATLIGKRIKNGKTLDQPILTGDFD